MIKLPTSRIGWRTLLIAGAVISNFLTIDGAVTDGRLGYATDVPFSHRLCNQGMYTGQTLCIIQKYLEIRLSVEHYRAGGLDLQKN